MIIHENEAAGVLADLLAAAMQAAYGDGSNPRTWLYGWERRGFVWLLDFKLRRKRWLLNAWTMAFIKLNEEAIRTSGRVSFDLKGHDAKKAVAV